MDAKTERDPRVDPRPGDVLHTPLTDNIQVVARAGNEVAWRYLGDRSLPDTYQWQIDGWQSAYSRATVIKKGDQ